MISHIWTPSSFWTPPLPLIPGNGGTETFTLGQCRELARRGIASQIVTFRLGEDDGRKHSPDIRFLGYRSPAEAPEFDGPGILATEPLRLRTTVPPFVMMHNLPLVGRDRRFYQEGYGGHRLIAPSSAAAHAWAEYLEIEPHRVGVVHPFAEAAFAAEPVPERTTATARVLFAGRLSVEKGIYTFFEALHFFADDPGFEFTVVLTGQQDPPFSIVEKLVRAHPMIKAVPMRKSASDMAALLVTQDVVVLPSHSVMWIEPFGTLSAEAQHAGCRVVASDLGGLPESDCGGLLLFRPDDPVALADAIRRAVKLGRLTAAERARAAEQRTPAQSVDELLRVLGSDLPIYT